MPNNGKLLLLASETQEWMPANFEISEVVPCQEARGIVEVGSCNRSKSSHGWVVLVFTLVELHDFAWFRCSSAAIVAATRRNRFKGLPGYPGRPPIRTGLCNSDALLVPMVEAAKRRGGGLCIRKDTVQKHSCRCLRGMTPVGKPPSLVAII